MIPRFSRSLTYDFNHLMYGDDLILVTTASRKVAMNVKLCLSIYASLTGQSPNSAKSEIFFLAWFNKRVSCSVSSILNFKI